MKKVW